MVWRNILFTFALFVMWFLPDDFCCEISFTAHPLQQDNLRLVIPVVE